MSDDLAQLDAVTIGRELRRRTVSATEVLEAVLAAIERANPRLLAYCTLVPDLARAAAREVDRKLAAGEPVGALAGVPVSIKDLILTRGIRTTGGCVAYADFVPEESDVAVERLIAADAVVLGKTNVSELGYSLTGDNPLFGVTRNPWDPTRSSGGSSAGAAAAVAAGMGPLALGSDGGGSIRVPAAFCGIFGFKPSMGRVPLYPGCRDERFPGLSSWESLEHIGPLTRTVAGAALMMSVIVGPDPRDRHSLPRDDTPWAACLEHDVREWRVGYCAGWGSLPVDPEIRAATAAAAETFRALGCTVEDVVPDWGNPVLQFRALMALDSDLAGMRALAERTGPRTSPNLAKFIAHAWTAEALTEAVKARKTVVNAMARLMTRFDLLLTPTTYAFPPAADKLPDAEDVERPLPLFTCIANMTGQPAASLPAGWSRAGLPIGVQLIGRHLADADVLAACAAFERARPWRQRWPSLSAPR